MNKRIRLAIAAAAVVGGFTISQAGAVSAAHCVSPAAEGVDTPGFSYFGTDHVKQDGHANEGSGRPHLGTPGASNCRDTTDSPSERAPGQNR